MTFGILYLFKDIYIYIYIYVVCVLTPLPELVGESRLIILYIYYI